jgi:gliding motility associated protien GldN
MVKSSVFRLLLLCLFINSITEYGVAQKNVITGGVLDDIYEPQHVPSRKPVIYPPIREADVMFKKKIWRMLDLRQKINFPLYYPLVPLEKNSSIRMSLIALILKGVKDEQMTVYDSDDDEFTTPLKSYKKIEEDLGGGFDTIPITTEAGEPGVSIQPKDIRYDQVTRYLMKEIWFFDKQRSMLQV